MAKQRKKLLIVDGYNVLRSGSRYRWQPRADEDYTDDFFNAARDRLINDVVNYAGRDMGAIIVFDAADNELSQGSRTKIGGVQVIFSPAGQSADKVIEKLAYDAGKRGVETMVVTSDAAIQDTVFGGGVDRMSADGFSHEMGEYYEDARLDDTPKVARKNTRRHPSAPEGTAERPLASANAAVRVVTAGVLSQFSASATNNCGK